jgi:hypothetical protein
VAGMPQASRLWQIRHNNPPLDRAFVFCYTRGIVNKQERKMFANAKNTIAKAVLRYNKQKELYKLIVAFNVTEKNKNGKYKFPAQNKCAYGRLCLRDVAKRLHTHFSYC